MFRFLFKYMLLWFSIALYSQPKIAFDKKEVDLGMISENGGIQTVSFKIKNTGNALLKINDISTSCGCVTSSTKKNEIGKDSSIDLNVSINPYNRPGFFSKTITIASNGDQEISNLIVKGIVMPNSRNPEVEYPVKRGNLRFSTNGFNIGTVTTDKPVERSLEIYNDSNKDIKLLRKTTMPSHIKLISSEMVLKAKQVSLLKISYNAKQKKDFGYVSDYVELFTNSSEDSLLPLSVHGTIEEFIPTLTTQQLDKAPKILVDKKEIYLGRYGKGSEVVGSFVLKNTGKTTLIIKTIKPSCSCVTAATPSDKIQQGQSEFLSFKIKSHELLGPNIKTITVFTNDPIDPVLVLNVKFDIF